MRSPHNPTFHWGNFVLVTDPQTADDAARWTRTFAHAFPGASHRAIGLPRLPVGEPYRRLGLAVSTDEVLIRDCCPDQVPVPVGYSSRPFTPEDWGALLAANEGENRLDARYPEDEHRTFLVAQQATRRDLVERGLAQWFGAFTEDGDLAAYLGIVLCTCLARYQAVGTHLDHRRRGLARHLLAEAGAWANARGASRWVIVTESVNPALHLYRGAGFVPDAVQVVAYRP
ncbi:MAG: GNAT family N-acetyltransferase [Actinobacteria bacterium]|uniref:Acetyltransferase (GNAT) family protein n=2 Tax=Nostocoides TaxID=99479 RepID=A0A077MG56_9MICO|nr:GNAT family N-acetyltransferase [Tetrasphaera jenkinsii]MCA0180987.1 GNAT family N-acetyltransferase [Actinomycetota bacterium]MCI1260670.1 GNAT family N-acetyltransferase [Tetrasphaera jenkinsii]CCI54312.1 Acetyltransferase (GNAT) family protein [Tetrasphaera jenkinsii Ben 74]